MKPAPIKRRGDAGCDADGAEQCAAAAPIKKSMHKQRFQLTCIVGLHFSAEYQPQLTPS